jgi:phosphatidylserine decarboxylase
MTLHREGKNIIITAILILGGLFFSNFFLFKKLDWVWLFWFVNLVLITFLYLILQFFRIPKRSISCAENDVLCPADGKVVVIEEVEETEYFKDKRIQISVFMSPLNVHANQYPISGENTYVKYHEGKFLVAWHPKSSTENERSTVVTRHKNGQEVLFRQIAGAVARRICLYAKEGQQAEAGKEFGFIKFGSRVDIFLPLGSEVLVNIDDKVKGIETILARLA